MTRLIYFVIAFSLLFVKSVSGQDIKAVDPFNKVIISPHIQVSFVEGDKESVTIERNLTEDENLHIEVKGKTLRIYLKDAKLFPMEDKLSKKGKVVKREHYPTTTVVAVVTYKTLKDASIRGEEKIDFVSPLKGDSFLLTLYGSTDITLNNVELNKLKATLYGESELNIKSGSVLQQKYTSYGISKIDAISVDSKDVRLISYGDGSFKINADKRIKITAYGGPSLKYSGQAEIKKGVNIGDLRIKKVQ